MGRRYTTTRKHKIDDDGKTILRWSGEAKDWVMLVKCATKREAVEYCAVLNGDREAQLRGDAKRRLAESYAYNVEEYA